MKTTETTTRPTYTPAEFANAAAEALENWDFDVLADDRSPEWIAAYREALDFDAEYAASVFADDDGLVRLDRAYSDVWDKLAEFAANCADNAAAADR